MKAKLLVLAIYISGTMVAQNTNTLILDCGNPIIYCSGEHQTNVKIGNNLNIKGGTEPYTYLWTSKIESSYLHADNILNDVTEANPTIKNAPNFAAKCIFYLTITDATNQSATDSLLVYFSENNNDFDFSFGLDKGDSLCLTPTKLFIDTLFAPTTFVVSQNDTIVLPHVFSPAETKELNYYTTDTLGCKTQNNTIKLDVNTIKPNDYKYISLINEGAIWNQIEYYDEVEALERGTTFTIKRFTIIGDTIVQNRNYKKLYQFSTNNFSKEKATLIGVVREYDKQVFYQHFPEPDYAEFLLYDFNIGSITTDGITIKKIEYKQLGLKQRKILTLSNGRILVEGVGCTQGFFEAYTDNTTSSSSKSLICYSYNDEQILFNGYTECLTTIDTTAITKQKFERDIKLSFANDFLLIESQIKMLQINIFDIQGHLLLQEEINGNQTINYQNLPSGIYLAVVRNVQGEILKTERIVKL